jgi:hypothetical protein
MILLRPYGPKRSFQERITQRPPHQRTTTAALAHLIKGLDVSDQGYVVHIHPFVKNILPPACHHPQDHPEQSNEA